MEITGKPFASFPHNILIVFCVISAGIEAKHLTACKRSSHARNCPIKYIATIVVIVNLICCYIN